jgi:hypothetical protein
LKAIHNPRQIHQCRLSAVANIVKEQIESNSQRAGKGDGVALCCCLNTAAQFAATHHEGSALVGEFGLRPILIKESFSLEVAVELLGNVSFDVGEQVFDEVVHCIEMNFYCFVVNDIF